MGPAYIYASKPRLTYKNRQMHKYPMMKEFTVKFSATIGKLKEGDWLQWLQEISMAFRAQRGWGYVHGSLTTPKGNTPKEVEWLAAHDKIVSALGTMVEAPL